MRKVNIGLIGFGTVGAGVVKALRQKQQFLRKRAGIDLCIKRICDKDISSSRRVKVNKGILTTKPDKIFNDPEIDIVVELVGGIHPAKEFILKAIKAGKHVVTANKALLAEAGKEIFEFAKIYGVEVYFEASVGGGIPIIKSLRQGLIANRISKLYGIINGTSNYVLTEMAESGCDFKDALLRAKKKGYAERNPSLDIKGIDSSHKLAILALLCFGREVKLSDIYVEGIQDISLSDIKYSREFGYVIKLLAIAKRAGDELEVRVHPTLIRRERLLSSVKGIYNAIYVRGDMIGDAVFYGQGAGQLPAASAVLSDIIDLVHNAGMTPQMACLQFDSSIKRLRKIDNIATRYYIRFMAIDRPGVLAVIANILGKFQISIASVIQKERNKQHVVPLVMMTHEAKESALRQAIKKINNLPVIKQKPVAIRIED